MEWSNNRKLLFFCFVPYVLVVVWCNRSFRDLLGTLLVAPTPGGWRCVGGIVIKSISTEPNSGQNPLLSYKCHTNTQGERERDPCTRKENKAKGNQREELCICIISTSFIQPTHKATTTMLYHRCLRMWKSYRLLMLYVSSDC